MKATTNIDAGAVNYREHVLYVEGNEDSLDVEVLREFLGNVLWVRPLGPASSLRSVAESLYPTHPRYYFLIDRDHHLTDESIDNYWRNFPDPNTNNLLVWRRKELENYFLEPALLLQSRYCMDEFKAENGKKLQEKIIASAQERLYLDAANYVIVSLREEIKKNRMTMFSNPADFAGEQSALEKLTQAPELLALGSRVAGLTTKQEIERRFKDCLAKMRGGRPSLEFGVGDWLQMISGKHLYRALIGPCFQVVDTEGKLIQGEAAINAVARDLLRTGQNLPNDLIELKRLIQERVQDQSTQP